jgi:hypothetical protein
MKESLSKPISTRLLIHRPVAFIVFVFSMLLHICPCESQTTIVVRRTPKEIVIGADSLMTLEHLHITASGKRERTRTTSSVCKIILVGGRAFAFAGYVGGTFGDVKVEAMGRDVLALRAPQLSILESSDVIIERLKRQLEPELENLRKTDLLSYRSETVDKATGQPKSILEMFFVAVEGAVPKLVVRTLKAKSSELDTVRLETLGVVCPSRVCSEDQTITGMGGLHDEILMYRKDKVFWAKKGNVGGIRHLIQLMIQASDEVGGFIDILRITKKGAAWVQRKPGCPSR